MRQVRGSLGAVLYCFLTVILFSAARVIAQTDSGTVSGGVVDPSGSIVVGAQLLLVDIDREATSPTVTNNAGLYIFHSVYPGRYRLAVSAKAFKVVNVTGLIVNTQAKREQNFALLIDSVSESITVEAKANEISMAGSTVVDRNFAENLPMNGRTFQTLVELTPGVVVVPTNVRDDGQFSLNGQRASSSYWTFVDTFSGRIFKNRTFSFFSYEGLRLRLPQSASSAVPSAIGGESVFSKISIFLVQLAVFVIFVCGLYKVVADTLHRILK